MQATQVEHVCIKHHLIKHINDTILSYIQHFHFTQQYLIK